MANNTQIPDEQANEIWSSMGLQPQAFPAYDTLPPVQFATGDGVTQATAGATFTSAFNLDNFPRMIVGLRIQNVWQMPETNVTADELALCEYVSRVVDLQQSVQINLTTTNITLRAAVPQNIMMGAHEVWHMFPAGFDAAGGNDFNVTVTRLTSYPVLRGTRINPKVYVSLVEIMLRADRPAMKLVRRGA
jgi:hypothetical protein